MSSSGEAAGAGVTPIESQYSSNSESNRRATSATASEGDSFGGDTAIGPSGEDGGVGSRSPSAEATSNGTPRGIGSESSATRASIGSGSEDARAGASSASRPKIGSCWVNIGVSGPPGRTPSGESDDRFTISAASNTAASEATTVSTTAHRDESAFPVEVEADAEAIGVRPDRAIGSSRSRVKTASDRSGAPRSPMVSLSNASSACSSAGVSSSFIGAQSDFLFHAKA